MTFLGAWLVAEYVYDPDGTYAGLVQQRRELEQLDNGRIRITQTCQPEACLANHAMGRFAGTHVFEIQVDGRFRRYLGPAVIGTGTPWGESAMTGRGVWPVFGHNFHSFAVLAAPARQLTGGKFFCASEMIANIVGVAAPEAEVSSYPDLTGPAAAFEITPIWQGSYRAFAADGELLQEEKCERRYTEIGRWRDVIDRAGDFFFNIGKPVLFRSGDVAMVGIAKQTGCLLEAALYESQGRCLELQDLFDGSDGHIVSMRRWLQDGVMEKVEILRLRPFAP